MRLGGSVKSHRLFPPYTRKGCTLPHGKKGLKAQRVKVVGKS
jgi:hypothetical protein